MLGVWVFVTNTIYGEVAPQMTAPIIWLRKPDHRIVQCCEYLIHCNTMIHGHQYKP